jgi:hypothetical protein
MILEDLINNFIEGGTYDEFCLKENLDVEAEVIELYMSAPVMVDNTVNFFEIEKTNGMIDYEENGVKYHNLFDFYFFLEVIDDYKRGRIKQTTNRELAERLIYYAINDSW